MDKNKMKEILYYFNGDENDLYEKINYIDMKSNKFNLNDRSELVFKMMYQFNKQRGLENIKKDLNLPINIPRDIDYQEFLNYLEMLKSYKMSLERRPNVKNLYDFMIICTMNRLLNMSDPNWTKIYSSNILGKEVEEIGKMYISVDNKDLYRFANLLLNKAVSSGLRDFEFKVNNDENITRKDNVVVYFTQQNMSKYISLINQIIEANPDIQLNEQNPLGYSIGKNICIGKDYKNGESFTSKICKAIVGLKNRGDSDTYIIDGIDDALKKHLKPVLDLFEQEKSEDDGRE